MTTTNQAMFFYIVLVVLFYFIGYKSTSIDPYMNALIGVFTALLLRAIIYKYNRLSFTE